MTFEKLIYADELFSFDDLQNIKFDLYRTDSDNAYGFYDIELKLLPLTKDKQYIFSFYRYFKDEGIQTKKFGLRFSFGETCIYSIAPMGLFDKNAKQYPEGVLRYSTVITVDNPYDKIKIRLIEPQFTKDFFGCKTLNGEEPYLHPNGAPAYFYVYGFQLEEYKETDWPSDYAPATFDEIKVGEAISSQSFQYFIYKLYGLKGSFMEQGNFKFFKEDETFLKEKRRLECGSTPCFQTYLDTNPNYFAPNKFNIYKYKNVIYNQSNIFDFFISEIQPFLSNIQDSDFPKLYTDFEKLYFIGQMYNLDGTKQGSLQKITYEKTHPRFSEAIIEIIRLLDKYKNFDNQTVTDGEKLYNLPISFPDVSHTPIKDQDFDNILFTGYLNKPVDLNIQAGFCRYYLNPEDPKPKISGYFYETLDFFDVKNTDLINEFDQILNIFPSQAEQINKRPSFYISDIRKLNFSRLIKNDSSVNFVKILNYTGYVDECYFKELKTGVSVELTGNYITSRRLSDVWEIEIKNSIDSTINDAQLGVTNIGVKSWTFQDFGPLKNSVTNSKYLKIIHKNIQLGNIIPVDIANVKLTSTVNGQTYVYSSKVL